MKAAALMLLATLLAPAARAQPIEGQGIFTRPVAVRSSLDAPVIEHRLANGLRVVLQPDPNAQRVAVAIAYGVGSRDDPDGYHGLAHLLEHMMFEGSRNVPPHAFHRYLEAAGVTERNGMTSADHTTYFEVLPARGLPLALWLESDRMAYLLDRASAEGLDRQRRVVVHEWNERTGTVSGGGLPEIVAAALYPDGHPYRRAADDPDDVEAAELRHVQHFFQRWYAPENATLAVVGAFDAERARALVEQWFGPIRATPGLSRARAASAPVMLPSERHLVVEAPVPRSALVIAWHTPPHLAPGDAELDLAANLLDDRRSLLRRRLVDEERLARTVTAHQDSRALCGTFLLDIALEEGAHPGRVLAVADEELERLRMAPPDPVALEAAIAGHQRGVLLAASELSTRAVRMAQWRTPDGAAYRPAWDLARYAAVDAFAVQQAVRAYLPRGRRVIVHIVADEDADILGDVVNSAEIPGSVRRAVSALVLAAACARPELPPPVEPLVSTPADPSRAEPPAEEGGVEPLVLPVTRSRRLPNGLTVYVVERHALPLVEIRYVSRRAGHYTPDAGRGIARLTAVVLGEEARASVIAIGAEHAQIVMNEPSGRFDDALRELARAVQSPALDATHIERLRDDALRAADDRLLNYAVRGRALRRLFGEEHPASVPTVGRASQIRDVRRDDVAAFHRGRYVPADSALVIVGDVEPERALARAEAELGHWNANAPPPERPPPPRRLVMRHELHVFHWRSPQARITVAQYAPRIGSPDRLAFTVLGLILAGPSTSRIGHELRSEQGVTYGVTSDLDLRRDHGVWWIETAVGRQHLVSSLLRIAAALRRAMEQPVDADELRIAARLYREGIAAQLETNGGIADLLVTELVHGTPVAGYGDLDRRLSALTPDDLLRVAREYLQPLGPFIAAGDLNELDGRLRGADVGEILLILPDDRFRRL